jgi:hypothetical protein
MRKMNGNEDDTGLESLQAQIDMSISFAQDLVSSWVESSKVAATSRSHDLEKELKEYMRRPPRYGEYSRLAFGPDLLFRLGVGAPIPESNGLSKAGTRLKDQLQDKLERNPTFEEKRELEECNGSDSPDESKASVIKKKARLGPLAAVSRPSKNKRGTNGVDPSLASDATGKSVLVGPVNPAVSQAGRLEVGSTAVSDTALELSTPEVRDGVTTMEIALPIDKVSEAVLAHSRCKQLEGSAPTLFLLIFNSALREFAAENCHS